MEEHLLDIIAPDSGNSWQNFIETADDWRFSNSF